MTDNPRTPRALVFDSGVGSLSIGAEIHRLLPDIDLLYAMDRGGFPYGMWQEQPLAEHICKQVVTLLHRHEVDMVVMACNSASTVVLPALRAELSIPVVGVVPAIKPAAQLSTTGVIGLLATPGTIARPYTAQLIADFARHCEVILVGDGALAPAIEALYWSGEDAIPVWRNTAETFRAHPNFSRMDTVVLACTHFPLVRERLAAAMVGHRENLTWIDSGEAIARRVAHLLAEGNLVRSNHPGQQQALILGGMAPSAHLLEELHRRGIQYLNGH